MPDHEHEMPLPDRAIPLQEIRRMVKDKTFRTLNSYLESLQRLQCQPFSPSNFDKIESTYKPRLSDENPHPLSFLEIPYQLASSLVINRDDEEDGNPLGHQLFENMLNLIGSLNLALLDQIPWFGPHPNGYQGLEISSGFNNELRTASYNLRSADLKFEWHQVDPSIAPRLSPRRHSMIAGLKSRLERPDHYTGALQIHLAVSEVPWGTREDGRPMIVRTKEQNILKGSLSPNQPYVTVAEGDYWQCRGLQNMLMRALGVRMINPHLD